MSHIDPHAEWKTTRLWGCLVCPRAPDGFVGFETDKQAEFLRHMLWKHKLTKDALRRAKSADTMHVCGDDRSHRTAVYQVDGKGVCSTLVISERIREKKPRRRRP